MRIKSVKLTSARKLLSSILLTFQIFALIITINTAYAQTWTGTTIYIRADGSIYPLDAPVTTVDGRIYIVHADVVTDGDGIIIERSNILLDGKGHTITGKGWGNGIKLANVENVTIRNIHLKNIGLG